LKKLGVFLTIRKNECHFRDQRIKMHLVVCDIFAFSILKTGRIICKYTKENRRKNYSLSTIIS